MAPKTERLELRVNDEFLAAVDNWRRNQPDLPPRAEAIRRLVFEALEKANKQPKPKAGR